MNSMCGLLLASVAGRHKEDGTKLKHAYHNTQENLPQSQTTKHTWILSFHTSIPSPYILGKCCFEIAKGVKLSF